MRTLLSGGCQSPDIEPAPCVDPPATSNAFEIHPWRLAIHAARYSEWQMTDSFAQESRPIDSNFESHNLVAGIGDSWSNVDALTEFTMHDRELIDESSSLAWIDSHADSDSEQRLEFMNESWSQSMMGGELPSTDWITWAQAVAAESVHNAIRMNPAVLRIWHATPVQPPIAGAKIPVVVVLGSPRGTVMSWMSASQDEMVRELSARSKAAQGSTAQFAAAIPASSTWGDPEASQRDEQSLQPSVSQADGADADSGSREAAGGTSANETTAPVDRTNSPGANSSIAVAGAFAVALSPPISRLLGPQTAAILDGGVIQTVWAWLKRRRKRPHAGDGDPQDSGSSTDSTDDPALAADSSPDLAMAGVACTTGLAAVAAFWRRGNGCTRRSRSVAQLPEFAHQDASTQTARR